MSESQTLHKEIEPMRENSNRVLETVLGGSQRNRSDHLFCRFQFGDASLGVQDFGIPMTVLGPVQEEAWYCRSPVERWTEDGMRLIHSGEFLLAAWQEPGDKPVRAAAQLAYDRLLQTIGKHGHSHIIKAWNFVPAINVGANDAERYKLFCAGRAKSFGQYGINDGCMPAGTAVGLADGNPLQVFVLSSSKRPDSVENPRQMSAFLYPQQYGPSSPSFSRATSIGVNGGQQIFVSGTAAIVGHQSRHDNDIVAQNKEICANLESIGRAAGLRAKLFDDRRYQGIYRCYLRQPEFYAKTLQALQNCGFPTDQMIFLQADICRSELLTEIDAIVTA